MFVCCFSRRKDSDLYLSSKRPKIIFLSAVVIFFFFPVKCFWVHLALAKVRNIFSVALLRQCRLCIVMAVRVLVTQ